MYTDSNFAAKLKSQGLNVLIDEDDQETLRRLDSGVENRSRIVCVTKLSLLRGHDYMTESANLTLMILKGFPHRRAFEQALARVGRSGQGC